MKTVLLPTHAEWCAKIINGRKTLEVRKTKPKADAPFKVMLYCTKGGRLLTKSHYNGEIYIASSRKYQKALEAVGNATLNGKIIGEFVCDKILPISVEYSNPEHEMANREFPFTGLTDKQIIEYLGNGKRGWGWHISELVIYDEPKELNQYQKKKSFTKRLWY